MGPSAITIKDMQEAFLSHDFTEDTLVQHFYDGLQVRDQHHLDSAAGGSLQDCAPSKAKQLIGIWYENNGHQGRSDRDL